MFVYKIRDLFPPLAVGRHRLNVATHRHALHFVGVRVRVEVGYRRLPGETKSEKTRRRFLA